MRLNIPKANNPSNSSNPTIDKLNKLLSSYSVLRQTLYNFHWNIEGQNFFDLHAHFGSLYEDVGEKIDICAEQIRILGGFPLSKLSEYVANSFLAEAEITTKDIEMVAKVKTDYQALVSYMTMLFNEGLDPGTENVIQGFIEEEGKKIWMLRSFLN